MERRHRNRLTAGATLTTLLLALSAGCGDDSEPTDTTTSEGLANPASEYCVAQGGTVEIVDEEGGQVGYCNLPDGTRIEEWEYYRAETGSTVAP